VSLRSLFRGWIGEQTACLGMTMFLNQKIYRRIHDVIVPASDGTTQIDHVLVSHFGIFVIETKNMGGWIFGREHDKNWTQVFPRNKFLFQNPLRQNYRHTKCLAGFLRLDHSLFHSIVFFIGECSLKTPMPRNVMTSGLSSYIKEFTRPRMDELQVAEVVGRLNQLKANPDLNRRNHVAVLKQRFEPTTICPRGDSALEEKITTQN
jgi:uncharacterized membrane protein